MVVFERWLRKCLHGRPTTEAALVVGGFLAENCEVLVDEMSFDRTIEVALLVGGCSETCEVFKTSQVSGVDFAQ